MTLLQVLAYAVILTFFGLNWQFSGFTAGLIYAFIQYVNQLFQPLIDVTQNFANLADLNPFSAGRVFEMMDRDDYEPKQAGSLKEIERGDIRLSMYLFLMIAKRDVLKEISFEVKNGQTIACVGHTGSGKSSIINLFIALL